MKKFEYTRYEKARIIGARALQLSAGAPPLIEVTNFVEKMDPVKVAIKEFEMGVIPITVRRRLPEKWQ
ncbi:MAG: DNA-directed RNA polymerase subunit K [Thermoplasmata archaeon]|nr:DNA-directed RNA polymerase subunit K [Euryarchaeota archaeon]RLF67338.1 MAG: DNA-directed RNA polymerase subunit K [Thermoplasmata archaeon]